MCFIDFSHIDEFLTLMIWLRCKTFTGQSSNGCMFDITRIESGHPSGVPAYIFL
jgi:hypothetical protein